MEKRILSLLLLALSVSAASCREKIDVPEPKGGIPYALQIPGQTPLTVTEVTVYMKMPEAIARVPDHIIYKHRITSDISINVAIDFGEWKNLLIYEDEMHKYSGLADGADAFDKSDNVVAKARVSRIVSGEGVEVKEYHYTGKRITFYCRSFYNFSGEKTSETDAKGGRRRDYFPNWPTSRY